MSCRVWWSTQYDWHVVSLVRGSMVSSFSSTWVHGTYARSAQAEGVGQICFAPCGTTCGTCAESPCKHMGLDFGPFAPRASWKRDLVLDLVAGGLGSGYHKTRCQVRLVSLL